jgi:hypothetical protein
VHVVEAVQESAEIPAGGAGSSVQAVPFQVAAMPLPIAIHVAGPEQDTPVRPLPGTGCIDHTVPFHSSANELRRTLQIGGNFTGLMQS